jgi:flagellar basal body rod protein FlgB
MLDGLTNSGSIPALQRLMQFTGQRHRLIVNNIANLSTPGFRPVDVSPEHFQQQLAQAIDKRRAARGGSGPPGSAMFAAGLTPSGPFGGLHDPSSVVEPMALNIQSTRQVEVTPDRMILHPEPVGDNLLFHDGNDRSVERIMQDLVENFMAYRTAAQFLRQQYDSIRSAIRERI